MALQMINKQTLNFQVLLESAPMEIKEILESLKRVKERDDHHPEESTFKHIEIVTTRLMKTGDFDLIVAGFFHDLGKLHTMEWDEQRGFYTMHGHEKESTKLAEKYSEWIDSLGANSKSVIEIVANHGKVYRFDEMRPARQQRFRELDNFEKLMIFQDADRMVLTNG